MTSQSGVHSKTASKKESEISPSLPSEKGTHTPAILCIGYLLACFFFFCTLFSSFLMHWHVPYPFSSSHPSAGGFADIIHLLCRGKLWGILTFTDTRTMYHALSPTFYSYQLLKHILRVLCPSHIVSTFLLNSLLFNI